MFQSSKLSAKFSLLLIVIFALGILASAVALSRALNNQVELEITERAEILLQTMQATRNYTSEKINAVVPHTMPDGTFVPETVPNYAARDVFERFRTGDEQFKDFSYKEASTNPTNPADRADALEVSLIQQFQQDQMGSLSGYKTEADRKLFYISRPIQVHQDSCLECHGNPQIAPPGLTEMYGVENGFGWQLNDVVAAQTIYVPADSVLARQNQYFLLVMKIFTVIFAIAVLLINFLLRRTVTQPITQLTRVAGMISSHRDEGQSFLPPNCATLSRLTRRRDEPGQLAKAFQYMLQVLANREQDLQQAVQERTQELRQEVRDRKKAQDALQVYFHAVSHDLRNLVMGISMMVQGLLPSGCRHQPETCPEAEVAITPSTLDLMDRTCDRQLNLINSLLEAHGAEIWTMVIKPQPLLVQDLVQELVGTWQPKLTEHQAVLRNQILHDLPAIEADATQLSRVFENLIDNALKYNPNGVTLTLQADRIQTSPEQQQRPYLRCTIADNGVGMAPEQQTHLFELYHRSTETQQIQGFGLGLYICRQIIVAHGGEIGINSTPNQGTEFWFTLPME